MGTRFSLRNRIAFSGRHVWLGALLLASVVGLPRSIAAQTASANSGATLETTSLLGRSLYALPDDATVTAARDKLAADPKNAGLALALSQAEAGRRQYKEAVATCTKALVFAPDDASLYLERGHRELGLREFAAARKDLQRATELAPKNLDGFYHLGLAH